ncbi:MULTISPECIES: hypothetical protein [Aequorivita]|uniref:Uncharacterized protein n=1 Tax=Aequorivita iocasae TaxID=2803865 RepID=A0ABX7DQQ8_9FLAO|nr:MULTISPECIES: hypothetical protein [Aequorivita]QQX76476.1 hypothetical protein JK629_14300 [Aequorivita iocasae]UCA55948.1 hypothetical protein LDL78_14370 [Aequorivita sp. F7]
MENWSENYSKVTAILSKYGWFISPVLTGGEFIEIEKICEKISNSKIPENEINKEINKVIAPIIFHPNYRAFLVFKAIKLTHLNKFSHLIDKATFHYYKKDFISVIVCLVTIVEGVLLSHYKCSNSFQNKKPSTRELIDTFCNMPLRTLKPYSRLVYSKALQECLSNWYFANTNKFDFSHSFLNRHYIAHSLGHENYYSILDCNRMFTIIDLISEIIVNDDYYHFPFIPDGEEILDERREYFFKLINGNLSLNKMKKIESKLLLQNIFYIPTENDINFKEIISNEVRRIKNFQEDFEEKFGSRKKKKSIFGKFKRK